MKLSNTVLFVIHHFTMKSLAKIIYFFFNKSVTLFYAKIKKKTTTTL